jgi:hypothetical protein
MRSSLAAAFLAATLLTAPACESEPPYQSQRCRELRSKVRMIDALRAMRMTDAFKESQAEVDAVVRGWREEQPECFDPSL